MGMHSIDLDLATVLASPRTCPACGCRSLSPLSDEQGVVFTCPECLRSWCLEVGSLVAVGPDRCPTCGDGLICPAHPAPDR